MNLKISLTSAESFSSVKQYQQRRENSHSVSEQRSVRTQTLGAIPVFKPLTGQCTGMAPNCIKRDLSHDGVWCGRGGGGGLGSGRWMTR